MPRSRNVSNYPEEFYSMAAAFSDGLRELYLGPFPVQRAAKIRHDWYGFVRSHESSADRGRNKAYAAQRAKRMAEAENILRAAHAIEEQHAIVAKYEVILEPEEDPRFAKLHFRYKSLGPEMQALAAALAPYLDPNKPRTILERLEAIASPSANVPLEQRLMSNQQPVDLRSDPLLGEFFTMTPMEKMKHMTLLPEDIAMALEQYGQTIEGLLALTAHIEDDLLREAQTNALHSYPTSPPALDTGGASG